ncbi:unnamed protein product, partial [Merluccius merluccius]
FHLGYGRRSVGRWGHQSACHRAITLRLMARPNAPIRTWGRRCGASRLNILPPGPPTFLG